MSIETTTLDNGLRVVTDSTPSVETVTLGVWLNVGARNESPEVNGIAHVLEHMAFKGTNKRSAKEIAEAIENVGGYMNAYTSRETTAYYTRLLKDDAALGVDILSDILQNSTFAENEFKREQSVIVQEIGQAYDTPDDIIFDYFQETCFPAQSMGRPILGTADIVKGLSSHTVKSYMRDHYGSGQMVLAAAGHISHEDLVIMAEDAFTQLEPRTLDTLEASQFKGGEYRQERDLEQAHLVFGMEGVSRKDDQYYAAALLSTMLGGGMSSRPFQEIREKRGLVYSIYAFHAAYSDTGVFGVYAGTSPEQTNELLEVVADQLKNFSSSAFSHDLKRAKAQLKASLMMSLESTSSRCEQLANHMHIYGQPMAAHTILEKVDAVNEDHIVAMAEKLFTKSPLSLVTLGPVANTMDLGQVTGLMH